MNQGRDIGKVSRRALKFSLAILLASTPLSNLYATGSDSDNERTSVMGAPTVISPPSCSYSFADTFQGTDSATSPPTAAHQGYNGNNVPGYFGPTVQLLFNYFGANPAPVAQQWPLATPQYTPPVPCNGYYEVSFTVDIRANEGPGCNYGENSMSIWVTTSDPKNPNAYGCPVTYVDSNGNSSLSPSVFTGRVSSCATFTNWVQCAWTNNYDSSQLQGFGNFEYYGVTPFPIFMYTPWWPFQYQGYMSSSPYPNLFNNPNISQCSEIPSGCFPTNSYQTAYCSMKPFSFKNIVYLNQGAQISAPALATQMPYTPYNIAEGNYAQCSFSVTGGKFKVIYRGATFP